MDEFINGLTEKVGLDRDQATKVVEFVKDHWDDVAGWIAKSGIADKLPGGGGSE